MGSELIGLRIRWKRSKNKGLRNKSVGQFPLGTNREWGALPERGSLSKLMYSTSCILWCFTMHLILYLPHFAPDSLGNTCSHIVKGLAGRRIGFLFARQILFNSGRLMLQRVCTVLPPENPFPRLSHFLVY